MAQLYGGFYQGFFLAVAVLVLAVVALAMPATRGALAARLRDDAWVLLALAVTVAAALWPWVQHYRGAQEVLGTRHWAEVATMVPRPATWIYVTPRALAYRWTHRAPIFRNLPWDFEHAVGLGLFTTASVLVAAYVCRRRAAVRLAMGTVLVLVVATTAVHGHSLWELLVAAVPSLGALRAVSRVGLLLPIAAAVVLGTWTEAARGRARAVALLVMVVCAAEQLASLSTHSRDVQRRWIAEVARRVDRRASAFMVTRSSDKGGAMLLHLDAMFAAALTGVPTVNGASGNEPPGWEQLQWARVRNEAAARRFRESLDAWLRSGGVEPATVQWIRLPPNFRGGDGLQRRRARR